MSSALEAPIASHGPAAPVATVAAVERAAGVLPIAYGAVHACVDLGSVTAVFRAARLLGPHDWLTPFTIIVGYNLLAFAMQVPLGVMVDRLKASRPAALLGLVLTAGSLFCIPLSVVGTLLLAGLGNALFHLGAGAIVLDASAGRAAPNGVFVAPGALGLGLGIWIGNFQDHAVWPIALLLVAAMLVIFYVRGEVRPAPALQGAEGPAYLWGAILVALLLSVAVRSFVGFGGAYQVPRTVFLVVGLPLVAFTGKLLGGLISDRVGWLETSVGALLISAPLIAFNGGSPYLALAGLLVFQTTMPVTLTASFLVLRGRPATAFGLPCFALVAGALPTFYPEGKALYAPVTFAVMILVSALAVAAALVMLGVGRGFRFTERQR